MFILGLSIFVLLFFWIIGIIMLRVMMISREDIVEKNIVYLAPLLGVFALMIIVQVLNLVISVKAMVVPLLIGAGILSIKYSKDIRYTLMIVLKIKFNILFIIIGMLILEYPIIARGELLSIQKFNNDIMYYLATMDWFQNHTLLEPVIYSSNAPYFWCAEYMIELTRLGFDVLASFVMTVLGLKSYQIFSIMGCVFVLICGFVVFFITNTALKTSIKFGKISMIFVFLGGGWIELITYQYCPQILGMSGLLAFWGLLIILYEEKTKEWIILTAFIITGTVTVYAEYAIYLLTIYFVIGITNIVVCKKNKLLSIIPAIQAGFLSLILNPIGIFICIKFNINTLLKAKDDISQLDPYFGKVLSLPNAVARCFGILQTKNWHNRFFIGVMLILMLSVLVYFIVLIIINCKVAKSSKETCLYYSLWLLFAYIMYFFYFHTIQYAYGEFKHLSTITPIVLVVFMYLNYNVSKIRNYKRIIICGLCSIFGLMSLSYTKITSDFYRELYYFDDSLYELSVAAKFIPNEEPIGISGKTASVHGLVYSLKEHNSLILANNISYYPFTLQASTKYMAVEANSLKAIPEITNIEGDIIWNNDRFILFENTGIRSDFYSGFHAVEMDQRGYFRWTCEEESVISLKNYSSVEKSIRIRFWAGAHGNVKKMIDVYSEGKKIANSITDNYITTEVINIKPNEEKYIKVVTDKPLEQNDTDGKLVGIRLENYSVLEYIKEKSNK